MFFSLLLAGAIVLPPHATRVERFAASARCKAEGGWSGPYLKRVRAAKMSWDHARIVHWDDWRLSGDRAALIRDWKARIAEFNIDAYRETVSRKTLEDYLNGLGK